MKLLRIAAGALNQTPLDWDGNAANILAAIDGARRRKVSLLCLPELGITGYGCEDAFHSAAVCDMAKQSLGEILPHTKGLAVSVGLPLMHTGALYNVSAMLVDARIAGLVAKQHLAGDGLHYEPRWFKPWPAGTVAQASLVGCDCLLGDLMFDFQGIRVGFEICEDAWVADRPATDQARRGVDIILNPSASHFAFGKSAVRRQLVTEASRVFGVTYCYSNLLGNEAGRIIYDGETLIASRGELVAWGPRLEFNQVVVTDAVVDIDATRMRRAQSVSYSPALGIADHRIVNANFNLPLSGPEPVSVYQSTWGESGNLKNEEFTRAISLSLFDYLRKSHSNGFVVSLSGGVDSAAVACLVAIMIRLGVSQLGFETFCTTVGATPVNPGPGDEIAALTRSLLTTVYQATQNSSESTRLAAKGVAEAIHSEHIELDVEDISSLYTKKIERALNRRLTWELDDHALQNIQARTRGPAAWLLANAKNALLLATSNRSEAAVGYATMDGDTCGSISPIAGIDKAFLRHWLRWLETEGPTGIGPIQKLRAVNVQKPTAELRPVAAEQTDENDLMPYDVLDAIERHAIGEKRSPQEVLGSTSVQFPQHSRGHLEVWTRRFFELWCRNQWKRERYAPSFHVDDKNLDPKTWCRFPILSGGFRRELAQLSEPI